MALSMPVRWPSRLAADIGVAEPRPLKHAPRRVCTCASASPSASPHPDTPQVSTSRVQAVLGAVDRAALRIIATMAPAFFSALAFCGSARRRRAAEQTHQRQHAMHVSATRVHVVKRTCYLGWAQRRVCAEGVSTALRPLAPRLAR